jgi:hypothetical protein
VQKLKKVTLQLDNTDPSTWTEHEVEDLCAFLAAQFASFPDTGRIYHQNVSALTDVTPRNTDPKYLKQDIEKLQSLPGPFFVVVYPQGPIGWAIGIGLALGAATYFLIPTPDVPQPPAALARNNQVGSPNNELSERANRARINGRIPDIYGTVRSTPDLIGAPYRIFENNREVEYAYMCVGRGSYVINADNVRDGETRVSDIPGTSVMIYEPYTSPNSYNPADPENTGPAQTIGQFIQVPVLTTRRSNSVNGQVLRPPTNGSWDGGSASAGIRFRYPNIIELQEDSPLDFTQEFNPGDTLTIAGAVLDTSDTTTMAVNAYAVRGQNLQQVYPGGSHTWNTIQGALYFFGAQPDFASFFVDGVNVTFTTNSVTSVGDISGTYEVGGFEIDGPDNAIEASYGVPTLTVVRLVNPDTVNATWLQPSFNTSWVGEGVRYSFNITISPPFDIDLDGVYTIVSVTRTQIVLDSPATVNSDWSTVLGTYNSTPYLDATLSASGEKWVGPYILEDPDTLEVYCNFVAANGLYKDNGTTQTAAGVQVAVEITPVDLNDDPTDDPQIFYHDMIGSSTLKEMVAGTLKAHPSGFYGRCSIRARRITPADLDFVGTVVDEVRWRDAYSVAFVEPAHFGNVTTVMSVTYATASALATKERKLNMIVQRMLPSWNGSAWSNELTGTNDSATILGAICRDMYIGNRSDDEIDTVNFFAVADEVEAYFDVDAVRFFNYTFDKDNLSFEEMVNAVAEAMFCVAYRRGNVIRLAFDRLNDNSAMLFNHRNKIPGSERRSVTFGSNQDNDGINYSYVDPTDYSINTIFLPPSYAAINPKKIESIGVADHLHAYFHAWRKWNRIRYQHTTVEFEATEEADLLIRNDRILVTDGTRRVVNEGEVTAVDGTELTLSQNIDISSGSHVIFLQHYDGTVESIAITAGTNADQVILAGAPALPLVTDPDRTVRTLYAIVPADEV